MAFKPLYSVVAVVGIALTGGAAWWYQTRATAPQAGAATSTVAAGSAKVAGVEVAKVAQVSLQDDAQAVGSLRSRQSVMLRPEVAGRIQSLGFMEGARVRKGQALVQLDDTLQRAELQQSAAQVSIAQANHKRNQELVAQNFVAQRVLDESAANLQVAQAQLALSQARLARMRITAPFDGTVGLRNVNLGDYVKDGADLVNLEDLSRMLVDFRLPERFENKLRPQQEVTLALDAFPGRVWKARVAAVDPLLDANGRSVAVRAVLSAQDAASLRPGMFARVTVVFGVNSTALAVPEEAIVPQAGKQYVVRLVQSDGQWVSRRQEVTLGVRKQGKVEITQGLALGDTVVVAGQHRLQKDGTAVRVVN